MEIKSFFSNNSDNFPFGLTPVSGASDLISRTFKTYKSNFLLLFALSLVFGALVQFINQSIANYTGMTTDPEVLTESINAILNNSPLAAAQTIDTSSYMAYLVSVLCTALFTDPLLYGGIAAVTIKHFFGQSRTAISCATPVITKYKDMFLSYLVAIIVFIGVFSAFIVVLLLVSLIFGFMAASPFLFVLFIVALLGVVVPLAIFAATCLIGLFPVVLCETPIGFTPLRRSFFVAKANFWRNFGVIFLFTVIASAVQLLVSSLLPPTFSDSALTCVSVVISGFVSPLTIIAVCHIYISRLFEEGSVVTSSVESL